MFQTGSELNTSDILLVNVIMVDGSLMIKIEDVLCLFSEHFTIWTLLIIMILNTRHPVTILHPMATMKITSNISRSESTNFLDHGPYPFKVELGGLKAFSK